MPVLLSPVTFVNSHSAKRWLEPNRVVARANRGFGSSQGFGGPWGYGGFIWIRRHEVLYLLKVVFL